MDTTPDLKLRPSVSNPEKTDVHFWLDVDNALVLLDKITEITSNVNVFIKIPR